MIRKNEKSIIWHISVLIFISWKITKAAKIILKTSVGNGKCDNMENTNKTVTHIPYTQDKSIFGFVLYILVFKNFTDLQQIFEIKQNFALTKKPKFWTLKIKYQQREVKLKCSINKKTIRHKRLFSATLPNKKLLLESIFSYFQ